MPLHPTGTIKNQLLLNPSTFLLSFELYIGGVRQLSWRDDCLVYVKSVHQVLTPEDVPIVFHPSSKSWNEFFESIKTLKWEKEYYANGCDGMRWKVLIERDAFLLQCVGYLKTPEDFDYLLESIDKLVGKEDLFGFASDEEE